MRVDNANELKPGSECQFVFSVNGKVRSRTSTRLDLSREAQTTTLTLPRQISTRT